MYIEIDCYARMLFLFEAVLPYLRSTVVGPAFPMLPVFFSLKRGNLVDNCKQKKYIFIYRKFFIIIYLKYKKIVCDFTLFTLQSRV